MRYIDRPPIGQFYQGTGFEFIPANPMAQSTHLDRFFGELSALDDDQFAELYVQQKSKNISEVELHLLADITKINVTAWRNFYNKHGQVGPDELLTAKSGQPRLIQIVAPIGSGKSTYLHYFLRLVIKRVPTLRDSLVYAIFDCRDHWNPTIPIEMAVYGFLQETAEKIFPCFSSESPQDFHKHGYQSLLKVFGPVLRREGISEDVEQAGSDKYEKQLQCIARYRSQPANWIEYIKQIYAHGMATHKEKRFVLALDNIDLFAELQPRDAVATLNQVGGRLNIDTIITLRDTTYRILQPHDRCTSWHNPSIIILPSIGSEQIAHKRLTKVKSVLQQEVSKDAFYRFIANILAQLDRPFASSSFDLSVIKDWLDNLSNFNTREMLDILLQSLKSHHLTSETFGKRFISAFFYDRKNSINVKRFKTAFIIGGSPYFSESDLRTSVVNLFEAHGGSHKGWDKQRRIFALKLLQHLAATEGFVVEEMIEKLHRVLGTEFISSSKDCLRRFWQKGLIIVEGLTDQDAQYNITNPKDAEFDHPRVQRGKSFVTPNGHFHLSVLIRDDIYLDEMKFATDFSDAEFHEVFDNRNQEEPLPRLRATGAFVRLIANREEECKNLSTALEVPMLGPEMTKAYNERKAKELAFWEDM